MLLDWLLFIFYFVFVTNCVQPGVLQELFEIERGICTKCKLDCHQLVEHIRPLSYEKRQKYIEKVAPKLAGRKKLWVPKSVISWLVICFKVVMAAWDSCMYNHVLRCEFSCHNLCMSKLEVLFLHDNCTIFHSILLWPCNKDIFHLYTMLIII